MQNLASRIKDAYDRSLDQPAVHLLFSHRPDLTLSYAELVQGASGYTLVLEKAGIQPGEVVILILQHGESLVYSFWGAVLYGAVPSIMPFMTEKLSPEQYQRSLSALFEITAPAAVITYREFASQASQAIAKSKSIRAVIIAEEVSSIEEVDFTRLKGIQRDAKEIVLLQHSSGTTGLQKGVALSHQAVLSQLESYTGALHLSSEDVVVSWLPLYHDMGLIACFLMPILYRIPLVLLSPFDWVRAPYRLFQAVSRYRGTLSWLPNFAYNFCAQKIRPRELEGIDLSSWRAINNCSEPMYWKSHKMFIERFQPYGLRPQALATCYAMAENVFAVSQGGIDSSVRIDVISRRSLVNNNIAQPSTGEEDSIFMLSAGSPIQGTRVCIVDEQHRLLPDRRLGEIAISSDYLLTSYYHRQDLTAKAFHHGWYLTGDIGYLADGEVFVTGRKKDLLIIGGKNIYPQDLEYLAGEVPGVHPGRVAAFGIFSEDTGTEEIIVIAETDGPGITQEDRYRISEEIRQRVTRGSDIALRQVRLVDRGWLLKTSSGKVARSANRDKYLAESRAVPTRSFSILLSRQD